MDNRHPTVESSKYNYITETLRPIFEFVIRTSLLSYNSKTRTEVKAHQLTCMEIIAFIFQNFWYYHLFQKHGPKYKLIICNLKKLIIFIVRTSGIIMNFKNTDRSESSSFNVMPY